jgi:uncharacterized protein YigA (DUF484 family)
MDSGLRDKILAEPAVILDDQDVMRALIEANTQALGSNIVDLRGVAMKRLEEQLGRLEDTHRTVIAAAYENLAGTNQVHRAVLAMMEPNDFDDFLEILENEVADILRVDCIRIVVETRKIDDAAARELADLSDIITVAIPYFVDLYLSQGLSTRTPIATRRLPRGAEQIYGDVARDLRTEACIKLNVGDGRLPAMLCLGSVDPDHFGPHQGTDLLSFFAGVFERLLQRWLAQ